MASDVAGKMGSSGESVGKAQYDSITNAYEKMHYLGDKLHVNIKLKELALKSLDFYNAHKNERGSTRQMLGGVGLALGGTGIAAGIIAATVATGGIAAAILVPGLLIFGAGTLMAGIGTYRSHKHLGNSSVSGHQFSKNSFKKIFAGATLGVLSLFGKGKKAKWEQEVETAKNFNNLKTLFTFLKSKPKDFNKTTINCFEINIPLLDNLSINNLKDPNSCFMQLCKNAAIEQIDKLPLSQGQKNELKDLVNNAKELSGLTQVINEKIEEFKESPIDTIVKALNNAIDSKRKNFTSDEKKEIKGALEQLPEGLRDEIKTLAKEVNIKQLFLLSSKGQACIRQIIGALEGIGGLDSKWDGLPEDLKKQINVLVVQKTDLNTIIKPIKGIVGSLNNGIISEGGQSTLTEDARREINNALKQLPEGLRNGIKTLVEKGKVEQLQTLVSLLRQEIRFKQDKLQENIQKLPQELQELVKNKISKSQNPIQYLEKLLSKQQNITIPKLDMQSLISALPTEIKNLLPKEGKPIDTINKLYEEMQKIKPEMLLNEEAKNNIINQVITQADDKIVPYFLILQEMVKNRNAMLGVLENIWEEGNELSQLDISKEEIEKLLNTFNTTLKSIEKEIIEKVIQGETFDINAFLQEKFTAIKTECENVLKNIDWIDAITELNLGGKLRNITSNL